MLTIAQAARALGAEWPHQDRTIAAIATDSRAAEPGCLFFALRGERFDAHNFLNEVATAQALAAVVDQAWAARNRAPLPIIAVPDTRLALGRLAAAWRQQIKTRVIAITGSNGKTTVKEMLASIARAAVGEDAVLATQGNFNNDIGMPLTLFRLRDTHRYAILEMGMNHAGELTYLSGLARPDVALINNAQSAHLEGLGSVENIARAKGEILSGLSESGIAVLNAEDASLPLWRELAGKRRVVTFGLSPTADVVGAAGEAGQLMIKTPAGNIDVSLQVRGLHNARNAVAAATAAYVAGIAPDAIARGLAAFTGVKGRLQASQGLEGARFIDDSYNANPDSTKAAIGVLAAETGVRVLVLGDMGELGPNAPALHREVGAYAKQAGIERLFGLGDLSKSAVEAFGEGGMHFERIEELLAELHNLLAPDVVVLVKGSRFMQMERVVKSFAAETGT